MANDRIPVAVDQDGTPMRICAVTSYLPTPQDTGDSLRILTMLRALGAIGTLSVFSVLRPDSTFAHVADLEDLIPDANVNVFNLDRFAGSMLPQARLARLGMSLMRLQPPLMLTPFSSALAAELRLNAGEFDLVVLIGEPAGLYAKAARAASKVIWDKANVMTAYFGDSARRGNRLKTRLWASFNRPLAALYERRVLRRTTCVWVTSDDEAKRLRSYFSVEADAVIPSVAGEVAVDVVAADFDSKQLAWISSFGYPPNWDGLVKYLDAASGLLAAEGATLRVIGRGADAKQIAWLQRFPCVDFYGYQEDLSRACSGVRAGIVPVWAGAGVKLKTLTLMQLGVPVIATSSAMEGVPAAVAIEVSDDPLAMTRAALDADVQELADAKGRGLAYVAAEGGPAAFRQAVREAVQRTQKVDP